MQTKEEIDVRKKISIELCENLVYRLTPGQKKEIKFGALIAIKNLIKESKINDPILENCLVDAITDEEIKDMVTRIIKEVANPHIIELLEIKFEETKLKYLANLIKQLP